MLQAPTSKPLTTRTVFTRQSQLYSRNLRSNLFPPPSFERALFGRALRASRVAINYAGNLQRMNKIDTSARPCMRPKPITMLLEGDTRKTSHRATNNFARATARTLRLDGMFCVKRADTQYPMTSDRAQSTRVMGTALKGSALPRRHSDNTVVDDPRPRVNTKQRTTTWRQVCLQRTQHEHPLILRT